MKRKLTLSPEPATIIAKLRLRLHDVWTIYHRLTFDIFMTVCLREYTPGLPPEDGTLCIDVTAWTPLTMTCVFYLVGICYHILQEW